MDNDTGNRKIMVDILASEFEVFEIENGWKAIETVNKHAEEIAVILLKCSPSFSEGLTALDYVEKKYAGKIPVLALCDREMDESIANHCIELGAWDFIRPPYDKTLVLNRVKNMGDLFIYKNGLEAKLEKQNDTLRRQYKFLQNQTENLEKAHMNTIEVLGTIIECRNLESSEHIRHIKEYTRILAEEMMQLYPEYELTEKKIEVIVSASALHDIGKITIPDSILLKPGKLNAEEYEYMKSHTTRGGEILSSVKGIWDKDCERVSYEICRHHHERYDGNGYPDRLKGEEIPISAQLVSVADAYEALVNDRVYKEAYSKEKAYYMIITGEAGVFSPRVLECFRRRREEIEAVK